MELKEVTQLCWTPNEGSQDLLRPLSNLENQLSVIICTLT